MQSRPDETDITPASPTRQRISVWRVLGTVLSVGLLVYLIATQGREDIAEVMGKLPLSIFLLAFGVFMVSRVFVTLRWLSLLRSARVKMTFMQAFRLMFMGNFASNFLPSTVGGDLVRLTGSVYLRVDAGVAAASLVLDRLTGMAGMSSLAPVGLWMMLHPLGAGAGLVEPSTMAPSLALGLLAPLEKIPGVGWLYRKTEKFVRSGLRSSVFWLKHPKSLLLALACTYGHMLCTFIAISLLLRGMHESLSLWWIGGLWSLSYFISLLPVSINGFGLQEVSIATLYSRFGGVSIEAGLALAIFMRLLQLLASLPGALFLPDILRPMPAAQPPASNK